MISKWELVRMCDRAFYLRAASLTYRWMQMRDSQIAVPGGTSCRVSFDFVSFGSSSRVLSALCRFHRSRVDRSSIKCCARSSDGKSVVIFRRARKIPR